MRLRGGRGGAGGGQGGGVSWERKVGKYVKCAYTQRNSPPAASTPLRAGSASSKQNAGLSRARFLGGVKAGKKGGFTSDSSNTPLGRRTAKPLNPKPYTLTKTFKPSPEPRVRVQGLGFRASLPRTLDLEALNPETLKPYLPKDCYRGLSNYQYYFGGSLLIVIVIVLWISKPYFNY